MVLLPEGKIINNPDSVKLIKVLPTTLEKDTFFVVAIKLDDDSELMLGRRETRMEAENLADHCCRLLNGETVESTDIPSFMADSNGEEESSDWEDSSEEAVATPVVQVTNGADEESSSWDMSSDESGPAVKEAAPEEAEQESSSWEASVEEPPVPKASAKSKQAKKPKIQEPYSEQTAKPTKSKSVQVSAGPTTQQPTSLEETSTSAVEAPVQEIPRVTAFIEDDSDEWIPDNGLDDWYD